MMGGSGGRIFTPGRPPGSVAKRVREQQEESQEQQYQQDVSTFLSGLLTDFNARETEAIQQHMDTILQALEAAGERALDVRFGGSVQKHTYVDGLSDVDALVLIDESGLAEASPAEVRRYFAERLRQRLPSTEIKEGGLAVTVRFSDDHEIQLLPALRSGGGYRIADSTGASWTSIRPQRFLKRLQDANAASGGKLVPTIKLAKGINAEFPEAKRLSGYHLEAIAVRALRSHEGPKTTKALLPHLYECASTLVLSPMRDPTGQSAWIDEYLGPKGSSARQAASRELARVAKRMRNADAIGSVDLWKALFGDGAQ